MSITIKYNNIDILDFITSLGGRASTKSINKNIASNFNNVYQDQGNMRYGQNFQYNQLSIKPIPVSIDLIGNHDFFTKVEENIGKVLNVYEPKELVFGDEPNKVWLAVPSGQPTLVSDYSTSPPAAVLSIQFDVPSARAENISYDSISIGSNSDFGTITKVSNNHYKATINNLGTSEAYPLLTIKHNSENGWIGLVNSDGQSYEIGNAEEVDKVPAKRSELLLDFRDDKIVNALTKATKNGAILNDNSQTIKGTIASQIIWNRPHLLLSTKGGITGNNGSSLTWTIPADSNGEVGSLNDYIWWRQIMWLGKSQQYGFMKLTVSDTDGQFLYGVETFKRSNSLTAEYNLLVSDGNGGYKIIDRNKFSPTHLDNQNPFNSTRGWSDIRRNDDRLTAYWWGSYPEKIVPELKGKKSAKIHFYFGAIGSYELPTHMYLDSFYYSKTYVDYMNDIPNRYPAGSNVQIDMSKGLVLVDGKPSNNDEIGEPEPLTLPSGPSEWDIYLSSWNASDPEITLSWKEMFV